MSKIKYDSIYISRRIVFLICNERFYVDDVVLKSNYVDDEYLSEMFREAEYELEYIKDTDLKAVQFKNDIPSTNFKTFIEFSKELISYGLSYRMKLNDNPYIKYFTIKHIKDL